MGEERDVRASLGCGTLVLIAIIVALFGGSSDHKRLEEKIDGLRSEIEALKFEIRSERQGSEELASDEDASRETNDGEEPGTGQ